MSQELKREKGERNIQRYRGGTKRKKRDPELRNAMIVGHGIVLGRKKRKRGGRSSQKEIRTSCKYRKKNPSVKTGIV